MTDKIRVKAVYVSDVHMGNPDAHCYAMLDFINQYDFDELYLVGDIFDKDYLRRNVKWTSCYSQFIRSMIDYGKTKKVFYLPGNHDDFMRDFFENCINGLCVYDTWQHTRNGQTTVILHGDQLEPEHFCRKELYYIGGFLYKQLVKINKLLCRVGLGCAWVGKIKRKSKKIINFINQYESRAAEYARSNSADRIITGHIHVPEIKTVEGIEYLNCGDWMENCTGLVEYLDGSIKIGRGNNSSCVRRL